MAEFFSLRAKSLRLLLVVVGVLSVFGLIKALTPFEEVRMTALSDLEAGQSTLVAVQAEPDSTLEFELEMVNGLVKSYEAETDGKGQASLEIPGEDLESAGNYSLAVAYKTLRTDFSVSQSFDVLAAEPDLTHSRISFSSNVLQPDQSSIMSVLLEDAFGNPVEGHLLSIVPDSSAVQVFTSEFGTNEKGQMSFSVLGNGDGVVQMHIFDSTLGQMILGPTQLALKGGPAVNDSVMLAESGPVDGFVISGLDSESLAGKDLSVTVKAIDADGFTVTDYTGTIRFSSSDDQASLPNDYTFLAEDQGEHDFSLGVKFVTPGDQTLTATDIENVRVNGEEDTEVTTDEQASTDYGSDFETTDFTREGDFELISPATGSYSSNTVEVQGEAEYGNTAFIFVNGEEAGETDIEFDNSFSYTLQDLEDGDYVIYVEIRSDQDTVIESSSSETVTIDTAAPTLVSISVTPETAVDPGSSVNVVVLSESDLDEVSVLFQEEVYTAEETTTSGKYQVTLVAPNTEGEYALDVLLVDVLGNEVQYRDQATLTVRAAEEVPVEETPPVVVESSVDTVTNVTAKGGVELVALSWDAPDSALAIAFYRIYYGPSPSALFALSETTDSSTNWTIPDLTANELYYFAVTAVDIEGTESDAGEAVLGVPEEDTTQTLPAPTYPVATNLDTNVSKTPETGPAATGLILLSTLGALGYVLLRRRARA